jgi:hypothetical protein
MNRNELRYAKGPPAFANDPTRSPALDLSTDQVEQLRGENFLSTRLIDYIIHCGMPKTLKQNVLIASSNSFSWFQEMNKKSDQKDKSYDARKEKVLRTRFQPYSLMGYHFLAVNCGRGHFSVTSVHFNINNEKIFDTVCIYDSLRRSTRKNDFPKQDSVPGMLLIQFQKFLSNFCFCDNDRNEVLTTNANFILSSSSYQNCPQQRNGFDCGLFGLGTLMHLVAGHSELENAFGPEHVTSLREGLYMRLTAKEEVNWDFLCSFFPCLRRESITYQPALIPLLHEQIETATQSQQSTFTDTNKCKSTEDFGDNLVQDVEPPAEEQQNTIESQESTGNNTNKCTNIESVREILPKDVELPQQEEENTIELQQDVELPQQEEENATQSQQSRGNNTNECNNTENVSDILVQEVELPGEKEDTFFIGMFIKNQKQYETLAQLDLDIEIYEKWEGMRLIIRNSDAHSRIYKCGTHLNCCFRAKFGRMRNGNNIILKTTWTHAYHSGRLAPATANGRAHKKRLKGRIEASVDQITKTKHHKPVALDVMRTAANFHGLETTYKQAYRAIEGFNEMKWEEDVSSFQLVVPYIKKFLDTNQGSIAEYELEADGHLTRVFVCPAFMNSAIRHARPIMSLDAAHIKSKWKGTLYVASVKTPCDEIFPVAMAITKDNENEAGWSWFLQLLRSACKFLAVDHPKASVTYKYFSFICDRQKGLIEALEKVFPHNHVSFCTIHIARNTERFAGKKVSGLVYSLSKTSSHLLAGDMLDNIGRLSVTAREYLEDIPAMQWRSTAWLDDPRLPPRFGIYTSNMSESTNNMFESARDGSWLLSMDTMLSTIMKRISKLREKHRGKEGVIDEVKGLLHERWDRCAGYEVYQLTEGSQEYTVVRHSTTSTERYTINASQKLCECGDWQEFGFPCVDALAYLRLHRRVAFHQVLTGYVDEHHTYEAEKGMLRANIIPVCIPTLRRDGTTLPPVPITKRRSGRPRKQRIRKRSRWAHEPEKSKVVCSRCNERGHNIRTCVTRQQRAAQLGEGNLDAAFNVLDL